MKLSMILEQKKDEFTKSEMKLYHHVKNNFDQSMYYSITELSELCGVGEATVLRFSRKLGFKGYQDFKLAVAQELSSQNLQKQHKEDDTFIEKIRTNMINVIDDTYNIVDEPILNEAIDSLDQAKNIVVFGVGHSAISAQDLKSRFLRIGKNVEVITDPHFQIMRSCSMDSETLIIAISLSGSTKDIVDAVSTAKENGAKVIAVTNYIKSPLTKSSDIVLLTAGKENPLDGGSLLSKVSQLYIIDLICTGYGIQHKEKSREMKKKTAEVVTNKLY